MPKVNSRGASGQKNRKLAPGNAYTGSNKKYQPNTPLSPNANSIGRIHLFVFPIG